MSILYFCEIKLVFWHGFRLGIIGRKRTGAESRELKEIPSCHSSPQITDTKNQEATAIERTGKQEFSTPISYILQIATWSLL